MSPRAGLGSPGFLRENPMKMIAKKAFRYGDRQLVAGDEFDTKTDRDATLLSAIRRADPSGEAADTAPVPSSSTDPADAPAPGKGPGKGRGKYQRRDLRAQD